MKKTFALLFSMALVMVAATGHAQTIDFEDRPDGNQQIFGVYAGFDWSNFSTISRGTNPGSGYDNAMDGDRAAFNRFGNPASLSSGSTFFFQSALIGAAWNNGLTVQIQGLLNGTLLFSESVVVNTTGSTLFNFGWGGINQLAFTASGGTDMGLGGSGTHFVIDNMVFGDAQAVPEPIAMLLLGTGLLGVGAIRRRRHCLEA